LPFGPAVIGIGATDSLMSWCERNRGEASRGTGWRRRSYLFIEQVGGE
jgi:hypothetical protein